MAALSLYLTYRARLSPYQEKIYDRQLDAASDVLLALGKFHDQVQGIIVGSATKDREGDLRIITADARIEFFRSYRRWNVVLPKSVSDAIAKYMQSFTEASSELFGGHDADNPTADDVTSKLSESYSQVLAAARQSIHVKELTNDTLHLIESQARTFEPEVVTDPLIVRILTERSTFDNFVDENRQATPAESSALKQEAATLRDQRNRLYVDNRNLVLIHTWRPSTRKDQLADISIRLTEHVRRGSKAGQASAERPLEAGLVERIEYDLGSSFRTFEKHNAEDGFRLDISAYGPTMCLARVHFRDDHQPITLYRYLEFIVSPLSAAPPRS